MPKGYSTDNLKYTSGDTSIASVTDKGVVTANKVGAKYINWYNYVRPHSHNNYLTPMEARYK